jgi:hypothetical protein
MRQAASCIPSSGTSECAMLTDRIFTELARVSSARCCRGRHSLSDYEARLQCRWQHCTFAFPTRARRCFRESPRWPARWGSASLRSKSAPADGRDVTETAGVADPNCKARGRAPAPLSMRFRSHPCRPNNPYGEERESKTLPPLVDRPSRLTLVDRPSRLTPPLSHHLNPSRPPRSRDSPRPRFASP